MSKTPELLPCHRCGGKAGKTTDPIGYGEACCIISCTQCNSQVEVNDPNFNVAENKAVIIWNTRVYPPEVQKAIERDTPKKIVDQYIRYNKKRGRCPGCDRHLDNQYAEEICPSCGQRLDWSEE